MPSTLTRSVIYCALGVIFGLLGGLLGGLTMMALGTVPMRLLPDSVRLGLECGLVLGPLTGLMRWRRGRAALVWAVVTFGWMLVWMRHPMAQFGALRWLRGATPRFILPQCFGHVVAALAMVAVLDLVHSRLFRE